MSPRRDPTIDLRDPDARARGRDADRPGELPARGWKDVALRVKDEAKKDNVALLAAGVAFYALLSLIPALIALVSIYGLFADPADVERQVQDVASGLPSEARDLLSQQLSSIVEGSTAGLSLGAVVGVVVALWSASSAMKHLIEAVNAAYDEEESRGFAKLRGGALLATVLAVLAATAALVLISFVPSLLADTDLGDAARVVLQVLRWPVLFVGYMVGLACVYRYGPDRDDPKWRWASWGALVATVLWIIGSILFSVYSARFGSYNETYGSLSAVVVLMLWLLLTAYTVVLGAEINSELERQTARDTTRDEPEPLGRRRAEVADTVGEARG